MSPARIFFVNRFYWPEEPATAQLLTDLAASLVACGHDVTVIARRPADVDTPARAVREGVVIERVRTTRWGRRSLAGRACDFATFYWSAFFRLLRLARRGDVIVALTDPPLIGVVAWFAAGLRGAVLMHWAQDIYPEVAVELTGHRWLLGLRPLRNLAWRRAAACVIPGADMARTVATALHGTTRIVVSPNWAPAGVAPPPNDAVATLRHAWGLDEKFVAVYSGNLGRVHDLAPLLEVAAALRDDPRFAFVFVGHGAQRAPLERAARARALANVSFHPPQPRERLAVTLAAGDVHFVTLCPGAERYVFPSKLYGIAQVGRPVIFVGRQDSELAQLVRSHGFGEAFARDEIDRIVHLLEAWRADAAGLAARRTAALGFLPRARADATNQWHQLISDVLADGRRPL